MHPSRTSKPFIRVYHPTHPSHHIGMSLAESRSHRSQRHITSRRGGRSRSWAAHLRARQCSSRRPCPARHGQEERPVSEARPVLGERGVLVWIGHVTHQAAVEERPIEPDDEVDDVEDPAAAVARQRAGCLGPYGIEDPKEEAYHHMMESATGSKVAGESPTAYTASVPLLTACENVLSPVHQGKHGHRYCLSIT